MQKPLKQILSFHEHSAYRQNKKQLELSDKWVRDRCIRKWQEWSHTFN